jgi:tetratricopeptide (TPR) repeat protein
MISTCPVGCKVALVAHVFVCRRRPPDHRLARRVARQDRTMTTRSPLTLLALLALAGACNTPPATSGGEAPPKREAGAAAVVSGADAGAVDPGLGAEIVAELSAVAGPEGVRTPDLAEGTFLGKGAKLRAGQRLIVPRGTLAELTLTSGGTLRVNEDSVVVLPAGPRRITLESGELVALITDGQAPLEVRAGGDTLEIRRGEARAFARDGAQRYAVIYGAARVDSGGSSIDLGPGASLETPLAPAAPREPVVSLRPLEETAWARAFEVAAQLADAAPPGVGSLTARRAGESLERYSVRLIDQKVNVTISGRIALTEIEQTFYNDAPLVLEGTYRFPLPADASISGLSLLVGNQWMEAAMLEKSRANRIFKAIVDATIPRDPALLQWEHGNTFKMKIFPIPGRGERKVRLRYTQVLDAVGDHLRYRYPLAGASSGASGTTIDNFAFKIDVDRQALPADAMAALRTPMAELDRRDLGDRIELITERRGFRPVHDLGVDIPLPPEERRMHAETHLDRDGQAYFMLAVQPELDLPADKRPVHYAFVLDRSHSMTPELWTVARHLVEALGVALDDRDRITVLACDTLCDAVSGGLRPAGADTLRDVDAFLQSQTLAGASDLGGMLRSAAEALSSAGGDGERVIVYLGDGAATAGPLAPDELLRELDAPLRGVRVQAVALGARSDDLVLEALSQKTGGDLVRADAKDGLRALVRELRIRAKVPVAQGLTLELPDGMIYTHASHTALRPGDTLVLVGKLGRPVDGLLKVRARGADGRELSDSFAVKLAADRSDTRGRHAHLPRTWAREEIAALTANEGERAKSTIIELSTRYTVLSRYTALLALENDAMYREFNVVRNAGGTDRWEGTLPAATPTADASVRREAGGEAAAAEPAPPPAPAPISAGSRDKGDSAGAKAKDAPGDAFDEEDRRVTREERREAAKEEAQDSPEEPMEEPESEAPARASASQPRPAPSPPAKSSAPASAADNEKKSAKKPMDLDDAFDGVGGGGVGYGSGAGYGYGGVASGRVRTPRVSINSDVAPSSRDRDRVEQLRRQRDADPTSRAAHRRLVQAAIYYGAPEAFEYARAWAEADPDHAPAMLAVADLLAARGEAIALRAYASAVEVKPFDRKLQARLADALLRKGDTARACAHLRALVSIDASNAEHHIELATCHARAGRLDLARIALEDGLSRARSASQSALRGLGAQLDRGVVPTLKEQALHSYPDLRASLTWSGDADLDIAVVDRLGRRLSALRPELVRVREQRGAEELTLQSINQPVYLEISRRGPAGPPVRATLKVKASGATKSFEITSDHQTLRLAKLAWVY